MISVPLINAVPVTLPVTALQSETGWNHIHVA